MAMPHASRAHVFVQVGALVVWTALFVAWLVRLWGLSPSLTVLVAGMLTAWIASDFASGFVHWLADTWGSDTMPVIGPALVQPFREHHVDPLGITRHSFVVTNGNTALISLPVLAMGAVWPAGSAPGEFASIALGGLAGWTLLTNQIHKWAHEPVPPWCIVPFQRVGLVLPPGHHAVHHASPNDSHYCITTGWCNGVLEAVSFFRVLERLVTGTTGMVPRAYLHARIVAADLQALAGPLPRNVPPPVRLP
jgi:ubiquitin-conjugating enzyme E2 variant